MRIRFDLRRECYFIDLRRAMLFAAIILGLAMTVCFFGGSTHVYTMLLLPRFAPNRAICVIVNTLFYILIGFALELIVSCERINRCFLPQIYITLVSMLLAGYLWFPIFFTAGAFFLSFVISCAVVLLAFFTLKNTYALCFPAGILFAAYFLWTLYCAIVNFCVFLLN